MLATCCRGGNYLSPFPLRVATPAFKYRFRRDECARVSLHSVCKYSVLLPASTWLLSREYSPMTGVCKSWSRFPFAPSFSLGPRLPRFISQGKVKVLGNNFLLVIVEREGGRKRKLMCGRDVEYNSNAMC